MHLSKASQTQVLHLRFYRSKIINKCKKGQPVSFQESKELFIWQQVITQHPPPYEPTPDELQTTINTLGALSKRAQVDLKPVQDLLKNSGAFGLEQDAVRTSQKVLRALDTRPSLDPSVSGEVQWALQEEERFAKPNYERLSKAQASRRRFLKTSAIGIGSVGGLAFVGGNMYNAIYETWYSPAALERKRQEKLEFERTHTLGTGFSSETPKGWRIRHPENVEPKVEYRETAVLRVDTASSTTGATDIKWPNGTRGFFGDEYENSQIKLDNHEASDGSNQPLLSVLISGTDSSGNYEYWLQGKPDPIIDHRVIQIQHRGTGQEKYIQITKPNNSSKVYLVKFVEKI